MKTESKEMICALMFQVLFLALLLSRWDDAVTLIVLFALDYITAHYVLYKVLRRGFGEEARKNYRGEPQPMASPY
jgi:hypothetical protein